MALVAVVALVTLVAGAGAGSTVVLVAYSTPREAYAELIPAFQKTAAGDGVDFSESYGASGEQSRARRGRPAGRRRHLLARARHDAARRRPASSTQTLGPEPVRRHRHQLGRRPRRPQGQPQGHHGLGRPPQARRRGDRAEPVHLRRRQVEHHGRVRRPASAGQDRGAGQVSTSPNSSSTCPCRTRARREALQTFVGGKGDVLLSYENEAIAAQQAGEAVDYVVPDETILIENPLAVTKDASDSPRRKAFVDFLYTPEAQTIFVATRLPPGRRRVVAGADEFPTPEKLFTIDDLGGWDDVDNDVLRPQRQRFDRATIEQSMASVPSSSGLSRSRGRSRRGRRRRRRRAARRSGGAPGSASPRDAVPQPHRAAPARRRRLARGRAAARPRSGRGRSSPDARAALQLTPRHLAHRRRDQRGHGDDHRLGARARRVPGQALVNSLIDLPFALPTIVAGLTLLALYGPRQPCRRRHRLHARRRDARAALRDAAVRGALGAARAARARPGRRGGRRSLGAHGFTVFRRIILPSLLPAIVSGAGLVVRTGHRRVRLRGADLGQHPVQATEVASVRIFALVESGDSAGAAAVAVVLLLISFAVLLGLAFVQRWGRRTDEQA